MKTIFPRLTYRIYKKRRANKHPKFRVPVGSFSFVISNLCSIIKSKGVGILIDFDAEIWYHKFEKFIIRRN